MIMLVLTVWALGCTPLKPYERGVLQSRNMMAPLDPLEASFDEHVFATREAMRGATGGGGAACGCL